MKYSIDINEDLLRKAQLASGIKSKRLVVQNALKLFISVSSQHSIADLWGSIQIDNEAIK